MATKNITDKQVCEAYRLARCLREVNDTMVWPEELLLEWTGQPEKVVWSAMDRACRRELIEYGVSLHAGWLTDKGYALLDRLTPPA